MWWWQRIFRARLALCAWDWLGMGLRWGWPGSRPTVARVTIRDCTEQPAVAVRWGKPGRPAPLLEYSAPADRISEERAGWVERAARTGSIAARIPAGPAVRTE